MSSQILHFDSRNAIYSNLQQNNSFQFDTSNPSTTPNAFNAEFKLPNSLQNVKSVSLVSIEMPIGFYNLRNNSNNTTFQFIYNSTTYTIVLPDGNYNSISSVVFLLNSSASALSGDGSAFSFVYSSGKVIFQSSGQTDFSIIDTAFSRILGFNSLFNSSGVNTLITASYNYNLTTDLYLNMLLTNLNTVSNNANQTKNTFKIPLNSIYNNVLYNGEFNTFKQKTSINSAGSISSITVVILDANGYNIHANGFDYSFTLKFDF